MFDPKTRILIVDDMLTLRKIVKKNLTAMAFTDLQEAADGNLAWEILNSASPLIQLVISDWNMPNCSGLQLLKKVRADARYAKLPFLMLTAEAEAHQIKEALAAGVSNYVIKPFGAETLQAKIEQLLQKSAA